MDGTGFDLDHAFSQGEAHLRRELARLAPWHLIDLIVARRLTPVHRADLNRMPREALTEIIVAQMQIKQR